MQSITRANSDCNTQTLRNLPQSNELNQQPKSMNTSTLLAHESDGVTQAPYCSSTFGKEMPVNN